MPDVAVSVSEPTPFRSSNHLDVASIAYVSLNASKTYVPEPVISPVPVADIIDASVSFAKYACNVTGVFAVNVSGTPSDVPTVPSEPIMS